MLLYLELPWHYLMILFCLFSGSFLLIYVNEYHVPVSSFTFHGDQSAVGIWITHIRKAQDLYQEARMSSTSAEKPSFPQSEIITEEVIGYTPLLIAGAEPLPLLQLTRCASEEPDPGHSMEEVSSPINRSRSWNEMTSRSSDSGQNNSQQVPMFVNSSMGGNVKSAPSDYDSIATSANIVGNHTQVQYSNSDPTVSSQFGMDDRLGVPHMSISASPSECDMSLLPELVDESMKSKLYQRRQSRTEKRYHTADAIQELNKFQNRDNSIYKRFSDRAPEKLGVLKNKTMSSDSIRSIHSSSGVSSTGSLHLSPEGDICEVDSDLEMNDDDMDIPVDMNEDDINHYKNNSQHTKSKSTPDIVSLMQDLNTEDMKDGITSVNLPLFDDPRKKLSHAQLLRMKKQLLLSSNVEARWVPQFHIFSCCF